MIPINLPDYVVFVGNIPNYSVVNVLINVALIGHFPPFLWLLSHSKWLRDIRDIAVHMHHLGNVMFNNL